MSKELQDLLAKLGTLDTRHEQLKDEVNQLKFELNKKEEPNMTLPNDFAQKIEDLMLLKLNLDDILNNFNLEANKRLKLEQMINNLNSELDSIKLSIKDLMNNTELNANQIEALKETLRLLDETFKSSHSWTQQELEKKVDKKELDSKVNIKRFDDVNNEMSNLINTCNLKNNSLEQELKTSSENILKELDCKLDRLELDSLKEYIEKQIKKIKRLQVKCFILKNYFFFIFL